MSVINKMLNDLDQREDSEQTQEEVAFLTPPVKRSKKWMVGLVGSVISGILAVIIGYMYYTELLRLDGALDLIKSKPTPTEQQPVQSATTKVDSAEDKTKEVASQPELIVIAKKQADGKPVERTSTLSVIAVPTKANSSVERTAQPKAEAQSATQLAAQSASGQPNNLSSNTQIDSDQQAIITAADQPKPPGFAKADASKMTIRRITLTPSQRVKKVYTAAKKLSQSGLIKKAIAKYHDALKIKPEHEGARSELAALYYGRAMIAQALGVLNEGLAIEPGNSRWSLLAAKIHYRRTNYSAALGYLQLPVHPMDETEYVAIKATTLQKLKDYTAAETAYRQLTT
ncbi:MAG: tetratricopeptide repeat protein, partial [Psychrosphaera sp.]|nr:tetratricopeptide repeat protein [Psychrosphaera sp.]